MDRSREKRYEANLQRRSVAAARPCHSVHVTPAPNDSGQPSPFRVNLPLQGRACQASISNFIIVLAAHQVKNISIAAATTCEHPAYYNHISPSASIDPICSDSLA
ncbi:hypothetical protein NA56DRAFT_697092 [Hyaloscypha hepaticicola]|uniref:Uncharacterized protein n=1 Tax=Hyaloscypha hepaticicola TaxID=2082293 RepID=A0A2J6QP67_9HELO|nr:hypothetical protein NA56DRAFT_697092 [Hyaloscypha hepaticicola]